MNIEIANRLYEYRKANGFSQEELAEKIGVSRQAISKWERSESSPDTDNLIALAKLYNVSLDEMINGASAPAKAEEAPVAEPVAEPQPEYAQPQQEHAYIPPAPENTQPYGAQTYTQTAVEEKKKMAPWIGALVWIGGFILFFLVGSLFPSGWSVSWIILLLLPAISSGIEAVIQNNPNRFLYPMLVVALFCALGMGFGLWHPAWILFITIPIYYIVTDNLKKSAEPQQGRSSLFITFAIIFAIAMSSTLGIVTHTAIHGRSGSSAASSIGSMFNYDNDDAYLIGGASVSGATIDSLEVNWVNGSITVNPTDGDGITFTESPTDNEDFQLRYLVDGNTLKIQFCKSHVTVKSLDDCRKDLTITVPAKVYNTLQIESVSADVNINATDASNLVVDNVSGAYTVTGSFGNVDVDNVSGKMVINNAAENGTVSIDTVSGSFDLYLPKDVTGFRAEGETVSGDLSCNGFGATTDAKNKTVIYGDGSGVNIQFDSVSGDLTINASM